MPLLLIAFVLSQTPAKPPAPPPQAPAVPFTGEAVQQVIQSHQSEIEACLNDAISERTEAKKKIRGGAVVVRFVLASNGTVKAATIKRSEPKSKEFHACLIEHIKAWTFPKPNDGKLHPIEYPFDVKLQN